jgi:hypothetical protein
MGITMDRISLLSLALDIAFVTLLLLRPAQRVAVRARRAKRRPTPPSW